MSGIPSMCSEFQKEIQRRLNLDVEDLKKQEEKRRQEWETLFNRFLNGKDKMKEQEMGPYSSSDLEDSEENHSEFESDSNGSDFETTTETGDESDIITQLLNETYAIVKRNSEKNDRKSISISSFDSRAEDKHPSIEKNNIDAESVTRQHTPKGKIMNLSRKSLLTAFDCNEDKDDILSESIKSSNIRCSRHFDGLDLFKNKSHSSTDIVFNETIAIDKHEIVINWLNNHSFLEREYSNCEIVHNNENFEQCSSSDSETKVQYKKHKVHHKKNESYKKKNTQKSSAKNKLNIKQENNSCIKTKRRDIELSSASSVDTTAYILSSRKNNKKSVSQPFPKRKLNNKLSLISKQKNNELREMEKLVYHPEKTILVNSDVCEDDVFHSLVKSNLNQATILNNKNHKNDLDFTIGESNEYLLNNQPPKKNKQQINANHNRHKILKRNLRSNVKDSACFNSTEINLQKNILETKTMNSQKCKQVDIVINNALKTSSVADFTICDTDTDKTLDDIFDIIPPNIGNSIVKMEQFFMSPIKKDIHTKDIFDDSSDTDENSSRKNSIVLKTLDETLDMDIFPLNTRYKSVSVETKNTNNRKIIPHIFIDDSQDSNNF